MSISRRDFLKFGASAGALLAAPRPLLAQLGRRAEPVPPITDPRLKALAQAALDAARAAGASYADVRLTYTMNRDGNGPGLGAGNGATSISFVHTEMLGVGVRSLVDGYWGFASSPSWNTDEMARLGRASVGQARANALGRPRRVELAPTSAVADGHWSMPVEIDPFEIAPEEVIDFLGGVELYTTRWERTSVTLKCEFQRQDVLFASTDGTAVTQRRYRTAGQMALDHSEGMRQLRANADFLDGAGKGWEYILRAPMRESIPRMLEQIRFDWSLPVKPVDVGRYDAVFDARSTALILDATLGRATELDRALGYEANAGGTSFLGDPAAMLGNERVGSPLVTVSGNRSAAGELATTRWDDEGVAPQDFALVRNGVVAGFQTTREQASWPGGGADRRSHGCAASPTALDAPAQHSPNLRLDAGAGTADVDDLVGGLTRGLAIVDAEVEMDFQCLNGLGFGKIYEVRGGKRTALISGGGFLFRAPELWRSVVALGGEKSRRSRACQARKGEPAQATWHTVTAVPVRVKDLTLIEPGRKS